MTRLSFVWLEITGKCQLECVHCYASSGPTGTHGPLTSEDWCRVIDQAADLGVRMVQLIGGEPTLHPALPTLIGHTLAAGVEVEVFSNLVHVSPAMWEVFAQPGVRLACSYYSDDANQHAAVTGRPRSYVRTRTNITEALRRSIPLRVGVIDMGADQRTTEGIAELTAMGVTDIGYDQLRRVGRGASGLSPSTAQLCGHCASGVLAIAASGEVWPCVFSRWLTVGNIRENSLAEILDHELARQVRAELAEQFAARSAPCVPNMCDPQCGPSCGPACNPSCWPHGTGPCRPNGGCVPNYG